MFTDQGRVRLEVTRAKARLIMQLLSQPLEKFWKWIIKSAEAFILGQRLDFFLSLSFRRVLLSSVRVFCNFTFLYTSAEPKKPTTLFAALPFQLSPSPSDCYHREVQTKRAERHLIIHPGGWLLLLLLENFISLVGSKLTKASARKRSHRDKQFFNQQINWLIKSGRWNFSSCALACLIKAQNGASLMHSTSSLAEAICIKISMKLGDKMRNFQTPPDQ
jgi:hypothetical protein